MSCFLSNSVNGDLWPQANDLVQTLNVLTLFIHTHSQPTCELYKLGLIFKHFFFLYIRKIRISIFFSMTSRLSHKDEWSIRHILVDIKNKTNSFNKTADRLLLANFFLNISSTQHRKGVNFSFPLFLRWRLRVLSTYGARRVQCPVATVITTRRLYFNAYPKGK